MIFTTQAGGRMLRARCIRQQRGWDIHLDGGDGVCVGAVALAWPGNPLLQLQHPGWADAGLAAGWAHELAMELACPVCVHCAVFGGQVPPQQQAALQAGAARLLAEVAAGLPRGRFAAPPAAAAETPDGI